MACSGECSVEIFDVNVSGITAGRPLVGSVFMDHLDPAKPNMCKTPTADQIANALRPKPKWAKECATPAGGDDTCICEFNDADLDPNSGWSPWTATPAPKSPEPISGAEGPDLPQNRYCRYPLSGTYYLSSKTIHGVCKPAPRKDLLPKRYVDGLEQRNRKPLPEKTDSPSPHK